MNHQARLWSTFSLVRVAQVAAAFVASVGCLVLIGWILHISVLKSVLPNLVTMKANTALGFILAGTALFASTEPKTSQQRWIGQLCSLAVVAIALVTLSEYLFGWDLGIDQLLFVDDPQPVGTLTPGRMSPLAAVCFAFVGSALWLSGAKRRSRNSLLTCWVERLAILTSLIAAQVVVAYLYQVHPIIGFTAYTQMAVHTAVCFVVLAIGILIANPDQGLMGIITADSAGGIIARRLLPAAIVIPSILGWLRITTARIGLFEPAFGTSILVILDIITFTWLTIWNSKQLHRIDLQRQATARALSQANDQLETRIQERTAQLQAANERLSLAIEGAGMAAWDMDLQTGRGLWSAQDFKLMGYDLVFSGEATIEMWRSRIYPEDLERVSQIEEQAKHEHKLLSYEYRIIRADNGQLRWLKSIGRFFYNEAGDAVCCRGIVFDITDSKQAEEERDRFFTLSAEQTRVLQQQADLLKLTSDAIFVRDERGAITYWNRGAEAVYGWTREEAIGRVTHTFLQTQTPEDFDLDQTLLQQESWQGELTHTCKNGQQIIVDSRQVLIRNQQGSPTGFLEVNRDITERKLAEQALREKEQQLQQLSDSMPQFVWITDAAGELEYVNRQWCEYSGLTQEQSRDRAKRAECYHPDDRELVFDSWAKVQETKQPFEIEGRLKRSTDGAYRWFLIRAVPALDDRGQVLRWYGASTDIHDRKLAELNDQFLNELDLRLRQLSDADAMLWEAVSSIGKYLNVERCVWHEVDLEADISIVKQDWRRQEDISSVVGVHRLSESILPELIDAFHAGQPAVVPDVATYPYTAPFAANFAERDIRSFVGVPCIYEGRWVAVLAINARTVQQWQPNQVALLQNTVARLWSMIEQTRAAQALRESEERFRSALLNVPLPIMLHTEDGEVLQINHVWREITGYHLEDIPTLAAWRERAYGDRKNEIQAKILSQYPLTERTAMGEYPVTTRTGETRIWDFNTAPLPPLPNGRKLVIVTAIDVTERKQAEADLQKYKDIFQFAEHGLAISRGSVIERINPAFAHMHGYTVEELTGDPILNLFPPETHAETMQFIQRLNEVGHLTHETVHRRKDGTVFPVLLDITMVQDESNLPYRIVNLFDITKRKQAEQEILNLNHELQQQLVESQTLLEVLPIGVGIAEDPDCEKIRVNSAMAQMLAIDPTENASLSAPEGERPTNFKVYQNQQELAPEDLPLQRAAALGIEVRDLEVEVVWHDGTTLTLLEYAAPLFDEDGRTRGSIGVFLNITERKQAELALQRSLKDLADFKFALDQSSIVAITDAQGTITYVNNKFCELSQYSPAELIGQNHRIINSGYHPKEFFQQMWATITKGQVWQGEIRNRAKDGTYYWVATTIVPFLNNTTGKPYQYIAVRSDITTRKAAEAELKQINITLEQRVEERTAQLQEANKDLEAFSYTIAHDLRAPLRGIQGFAQALVEDYGDRLDETAQDYIQHIFDGTERMNELVSDLLAYSRLSREQIRLIPVQLTQVVAEAQAQLEAELRDRQALIAVAEDLPKVLAHRSILVQMVVNLLSNAVKFVASDVQPHIRVWAQTQENWVRLWVEDNGIGIESAYLEQIFGVFERLHGIEAYPGTGIGLAIVRKGAERLEGRSGVESAPGQGSRFWVELHGVR